MADWKSLSQQAMDSAKILQDRKDFRGSINRAYYAAYSAIAHALPSGLTFPSGMKNPPHSLIPYYLRRNLAFPKPHDRYNILKAFNYLRSLRVASDYNPAQNVDSDASIQCIMHARTILVRLEEH